MKSYTANSTMGTVLQKLIDNAEGSSRSETMVVDLDIQLRTFEAYTMKEWKEKQKDDEVKEQIRRAKRLGEFPFTKIEETDKASKDKQGEYIRLRDVLGRNSKIGALPDNIQREIEGLLNKR